MVAGEGLYPPADDTDSGGIGDVNGNRFARREIGGRLADADAVVVGGTHSLRR